MNANLTSSQRKALEDLQLLLKDEVPAELNDPRWYKRFLIARDYNVKQAESMIRKHLRWQKEIQVDTILTDFKCPEVIQKYISWSIIGLDKDGSPVRYVAIGKMDEIGFLKSINVSSFMKTIISFIYEEIEICQKRGDSFSQTNNIFDLSGLTYAKIFNKVVIQELIGLANLFQDNYPEYMKRLILINASTTFTTIWPVFKKYVGSNLMQKIFVYGGDGWEELRRIIDADVLPAFLGGNRRDPDGNPLCLKTVSHGGTIDKKYYALFRPEEYLKHLGTKTVKINRKSCLKVPILVTELNSVINWEFFVEAHHDVGFGLLQENMDGTLEECIPIHRRKTENLPDCGMYRCKIPGSYFIIFDNSHSWMNAKIVFYRIWISQAEPIDMVKIQ